MSDHFGNHIAELRRKKGLSQADLAAASALSQATISRLEAADRFTKDIRLLSKVANALREPLSDLLPDDFLQETLQTNGEETFFAFCPNPFCTENTNGLDNDGNPFIRWTSNGIHQSAQFDQTNFCAACGTELVKECPSCKRRFEHKRTKFCITCGSQVCDRPTAEEWQRIREIYEPKRPDNFPGAEEMPPPDNFPGEAEIPF